MPRIASIVAVLVAVGGAFAEAPKTAGPRLEVTMEGPHLKYVGPTSNYAIKVTNPGDAPAKHVVLRYQVSANFKVVSMSDEGAENPITRTITWKWDELRPNTTRSVKLQLQAKNAHPSCHACSVTGDGGLEDGVTFGNSMAGGLPDLLLEVVDRDDPVEVGGIATYEIRLSNISSEKYTNIQLRAKVPPGMKMNRIVAPMACTWAADEVIFESIELTQRKDIIVRIDCAVKRRVSEKVCFQASFTTDDDPEPVIECEATQVLERDRAEEFHP
jgi:uncharacterized repeat protein (TIGR01451 family)